MMNPKIQSLQRPQTQRGLTLVEIMVAVTLALLLLAGTVQIFLGSKQAYRTEEALSRIQENGRFSMEFLATSIRKTGYTGCLASNELSNVDSILNTTSNDYGWDFSHMIVGYEATGSGTWSPTLPTALSGSVKSGTDAITIRYMASNGISLVPPYSDSAQLFADPSLVYSAVAVGDVAMVTDCKKGTVFQITNLQAAGGKVNVVHSQASYTPGNSQSLLTQSYGEDAELAAFVTESFYIKDNPTTGVPGLYHSFLTTSGGNTAILSEQELVEGVEDMQILYGEDTNGDDTANRYVSADNVGDMSKVVSVRISVLTRSHSAHITTGNQTYTYPSWAAATTTASDRRLRHAFTTTITLRNRVK